MSIARVGNSLTEIQPPLNIKHDIMIEYPYFENLNMAQ